MEAIWTAVPMVGMALEGDQGQKSAIIFASNLIHIHLLSLKSQAYEGIFNHERRRRKQNLAQMTIEHRVVNRGIGRAIDSAGDRVDAIYEVITDVLENPRFLSLSVHLNTF